MTKDVPRITRWWWLRHAPVPERRGRVFGQMDVDADISDVAILNSLGLMSAPGRPVGHQPAETCQSDSGGIGEGGGP
jgi:hypothetical protein